MTDEIQDPYVAESVDYTEQSCHDCGAEFKITMLESPDEGRFRRDYCPHCGVLLK